MERAQTAGPTAGSWRGVHWHVVRPEQVESLVRARPPPLAAREEMLRAFR